MSWNCGPRALSGVSAPSGGPAPLAVAASVEERRATVELGVCNGKRSACPETGDSPFFSVFTSSTSRVHWPGVVSVVVVCFAKVGDVFTSSTPRVHWPVVVSVVVVSFAKLPG